MTNKTAAPRTPAERLIELQQEFHRQEIKLDDLLAEKKLLDQRLWRYHIFTGVSFGGVPMAQQWCDMLLWEGILNENLLLRGIIEIGTMQGGFSVWLKAQADLRGMEFSTYDVVTPQRIIPGFHKLDVFAEPAVIKNEIRRLEPVLLFCDGGNKPRELETFAPHMTDPRSLIMVHDWGTEIGPADVPDSVVEVYGDYCDMLGSPTRAFRSKS